MAKHLNDKVGSMEYDKLIAGITPPVKVASGIITKLSAAATYPRGTVLCRSSGTGEDPRHHRRRERDSDPRLHSLR